MDTTLKPVQILMVEDDENDAVFTTTRLRKSKIFSMINVVENGQKALDYLYKQGVYKDATRPDLILLDLNLPCLSGKEVLQQIKKDPDLCAIPVVVLTSSEEQEDVDASYRLHAAAYIKKPVDLDGYHRIAAAIDDFWLGLVKFPKSF